MVGHCRDTYRHWRDTLRLGTAGISGGWALQGYSAFERCRNTLLVGHCRDTRRLGTAVVHCRYSWWLDAAEILYGGHCAWAPQGYVAIEHCSQAPRRGRGQHRHSKSNNPTARVGKNGLSPAALRAICPTSFRLRLRLAFQDPKDCFV